MRLLQPSSNIQLSKKNPDRFLKRACEIIRKGWGQPSVFNADLVVEELLRQGKSHRGRAVRRHERLRRDGRVRQGSLHPHRLLQPAEGARDHAEQRRRPAHRPADRHRRPATRARSAPSTSCSSAFRDAAAALRGRQDPRQQRHRAALRDAACRRRSCRSSSTTASRTGRDYNAGGARYNTTYIMPVGLGTIDRQPVGDQAPRLRAEGARRWASLLEALRGELRGPRAAAADALEPDAAVRQRRRVRRRDPPGRVRRAVRRGRRPAEHQGRAVPRQLPFHDLPRLLRLDGRARRPDGREAGEPVSDGISPVQGADRARPDGVIKSAAQMDHARTGGTLLNQKFTPRAARGRGRASTSWRTWCGRTSSSTATTSSSTWSRPRRCGRRRQNPEKHRDLIVRVAGTATTSAT